jgi:hypothetical protein
LPQVGGARNVTGVTEGPPGDTTGGKGDRDEAALDDLRWHWGSAYDIDFDGKRWAAEHRATGHSLTSETPYGLRDLIVADYSAHPQAADGPETGEPGHRDRP